MTEILSKKIGVVFRYNGVRLMVVQAVDRCRGCYFHHHTICQSYTAQLGACNAAWRYDHKNVIFRKYDNAKKENKHIRLARPTR